MSFKNFFSKRTFFETPATRSNLFTVILETISTLAGLPGLGMAIGLAVSGYFRDNPDHKDTTETDKVGAKEPGIQSETKSSPDT